MRRVAAAAALCCGCNQIYGLDPTRTRDAAPNPDASDRALQLTLVTTETQGPMEGEVRTGPLPNTVVRIALPDEPLVETTYFASSTGGLVDYPDAFVGKVWRLEYTPPFDVAHELQWNPPVGGGHMIAPLVGRVDRTVPPANTGYTLSMKKPDNSLYSFSPNTVLYTTGYFSATPSAFQTLTPSVDFASTTSVPLDGPRSGPAATGQDVVIAIEYEADNGCTRARMSGFASAMPLEPGVMKPLALTLSGAAESPPSLMFAGPGMLDAQVRLAASLGPLAGDTSGSRARYGRIATTKLPELTTERDGVPSPVLIPLFDCPLFSSPTMAINEATGGIILPKAFHAYTTDDRLVDGARLRSSIAVVGLHNGTAYEATTQVALATAIQLGSTALTTDGVTIGASPLDLSFALGPNADYYEATLYRLAGTALEPVRVYTGNDVDAARPDLRFDPSVMTAGATYVFAIRTYRGRPVAKVGDFSTIKNPQAVGTIFTSTFKR